MFTIGIGIFWLYGIYTTFFVGRIPGFDWATSHNIILGLLWTFFLGYGAPLPAKVFRQTLGIVAIWRRGYLYIPLFSLNFLIQFYLWVIVITVWFKQALPRPFQSFEGGVFSGAIALSIMIPLCLVGNLSICRLIKSITKSRPKIDGQQAGVGNRINPPETSRAP